MKSLRRFMDWFHSLAGGWPARLACGALLGLASLDFFLIAMLVIRGRPWAFLVYAENPYAHFFGGWALLAAWHWCRAGYREPAAVWARRFGKALLMSASLAMVFAIGEIGLRAMLTARQRGNAAGDLDRLEVNQTRQPIRSTHPLGTIIQRSPWKSVVYELQPNLDTVFGGRQLRTNRAGMRADRDYSATRQSGTLRIVGLGDSGMFGWNVEQGQNYMAVLEELLNARSGAAPVEVLNLAVPGYNTRLELETLRHKGLAYAPDIVVVGWCENDGELPFFLLEKENYARQDVSFLHLLLFRRAAFRAVAAGTTLKDLRSMQREKVDPDMLSGTEAAGLRQAFSELKQLGDERGFRVLVFGPLGQGVRELLKGLGLPYYNTRAHVDAGRYPPEWKVHFMHPSAEGHRVLAEHLAAELDRLGWLAPVGTERKRLSGQSGSGNLPQESSAP